MCCNRRCSFGTVDARRRRREVCSQDNQRRCARYVCGFWKLTVNTVPNIIIIIIKSLLNLRFLFIFFASLILLFFPSSHSRASLHAGPHPAQPVVASLRVPKVAREKIRQAFLSVEPHTLKPLRLSRYVPVDASLYEPIQREMAAIEAFLQRRKVAQKHRVDSKKDQANSRSQGDGIIW